MPARKPRPSNTSGENDNVYCKKSVSYVKFSIQKHSLHQKVLEQNREIKKQLRSDLPPFEKIWNPASVWYKDVPYFGHEISQLGTILFNIETT